MQCVDRQSDHMWILGENLCISSSGHLITTSESNNVWISNIFSGPGIPSQVISCRVALPLSTEPLEAVPYHPLSLLRFDRALAVLPHSISFWNKWNWQNHGP